MSATKTAKNLAITAAFALCAQYLGGIIGASGLEQEAGRQANLTPHFQSGHLQRPDQRTATANPQLRFFTYDNEVTALLQYNDAPSITCKYTGRTYHLFGVPVHTRKTLDCTPG